MCNLGEVARDSSFFFHATSDGEVYLGSGGFICKMTHSYWLCLKKNSVTLDNNGTADFIQDHKDRYHRSGILWWGERLGLTLNIAEASICIQRNLYPKTRDGDSWWHFTKRQHGLSGGFWLNWPRGFLLKINPGDQTSPGRWWQMKDMIQYQGWSDIKDWGGGSG